MLSIAVVDDDPRHRQEIAEAAEAHLKALGQAARVTAFADAESFLAEAVARPFDLAILDIILPRKNGLTAALELYQRDHGCRIVFLTVSPDYAIHGYKVDALDYLLKPVDPAALGRALDKYLAPAAGPAPAIIILRDGRELKKVRVADILYCQSEGRNVHFHGPDWKLTCRGKLGDFAGRLPACFIPTHNRYLVNLARVAAMTPEAMRFDNGDEAPISRAYRERAAAAYFDHVVGEARRP